MILVNDQMQVCNLFVDKFYLEPLAVWETNKADRTISKVSNNRDRPTNQTIKNDWSVKLISIQHQLIETNCLVKPKVIANK